LLVGVPLKFATTGMTGAVVVVVMGVVVVVDVVTVVVVLPGFAPKSEETRRIELLPSE
jgi:hypothetical protein